MIKISDMEEKIITNYHHGLSISDSLPIIQSIIGIFILITLAVLFINSQTTQFSSIKIILTVLSFLVIILGIIFVYFKIIFLRKRHANHGIK